MFSADDHISLAEDIFYERFPESMKEQAPRVMYEDGAWMLGIGRQVVPAREFTAVLTQYDPLPGVAHQRHRGAARGARLRGRPPRSWRSPTRCSALFGWPDKEVRELCFRIYNEHIAELQERSNGRFYGVGLINWWDADGARRTLDRAEGARPQDVPACRSSPGKDDDGKPDRLQRARRCTRVWEAIEESGLPVVAPHRREPAGVAVPSTTASRVGMMHNVAPFREMFGKYVFGGILDRHPGLRVGWFEGGINWVPAALQDAEHLYASLQHMADHEIEHDAAALLGATTCAPRSWSTRSGSS